MHFLFPKQAYTSKITFFILFCRIWQDFWGNFLFCEYNTKIKQSVQGYIIFLDKNLTIPTKLILFYN